MVLLIVGIIAALFLFEYYFRKVIKEKGDKIFYLEMLLAAAILLGLIGAYVVQNLYDLIADPAHYAWQWKSTFFGGAIFGVGGFVLLYFIFVRKKYPEGLGKIFVIAPAAIALAHGFGRIGCFLEGCCYGIESDAWYAMYFPSLDKTVIPTQLFEAIFLFVLAATLILIAFKKQSLLTIPVYAIGYGVWRFLIEFLRDDDRGSFLPGLSPSQFWALLLALAGIGFLVYLLIRKRKAAQAQ
ncbi:MAG: prolipoprotein diacylglyceryl transferase [Bacilli bacterium]|nr:prolipoprotein diacylglyceryl transferase [Bacilli bacterium]